jgi:hypothetical protein
MRWDSLLSHPGSCPADRVHLNQSGLSPLRCISATDYCVTISQGRNSATVETWSVAPPELLHVWTVPGYERKSEKSDGRVDCDYVSGLCRRGTMTVAGTVRLAGNPSLPAHQGCWRKYYDPEPV